jgi:hypothetical protein
VYQYQTGVYQNNALCSFVIARVETIQSIRHLNNIFIYLLGRL